MQTLHIYHGGLPFTYFVFGPYANGTEWDVEVHKGHVAQGSVDTYVFTQSDLPRDTHIVTDMWDAMDDAVNQQHWNLV